VIERKAAKRARRVMVELFAAADRYNPFSADVQRRSRLRRWLIRTVEGPWVENIMQAVVLCNVLLLALTWYRQPRAWTRVQDNAAFVFTGVFVFEAAVKIFALRRDYFKDDWNKLDFFMALATLAESIAQLVAAGATGAFSNEGKHFLSVPLFKSFRHLFKHLCSVPTP
jgi:hypothetical protein